MTTQITATYVTNTYSTSPTIAKAAMAAAPLDWLPLLVYGLLPHSDETTNSGSQITRTIKLYMVPTSAGSATATMVGNGSSIESVTVTAAGNAYPKQPVITFDGSPITPASAIAKMQVSEGTILNGGTGYTNPVAILSSGGLAPGGTPAVITLGLSGGVVNSVGITTPGGPYITPPVVTVVDEVVDATGKGAVVVLGLSISGITVSAPDATATITAGIGAGFSYGSVPDVIITPYFKAMIASGSASEEGAIGNWMTGILANAVSAPVQETITVS